MRPPIAEVLPLLRQARDLLSRPDAWCQGTLAQDAKGETTGPRRATAVRWDAVGALSHFLPEGKYPQVAIAAFQRVGIRDLAAWNDAPGREQCEVVALFGQLIALLEAEGGK